MSEPASNSGRNIVFGLLAVALVFGLLVFLIGAGSDDGDVSGQVLPDPDSIPEQENQPEQDDVTEEDNLAEGPVFFGDPFRPDSVAIDASSVWVSDAACGAVVRIDKATEEVVGAVDVGVSASGVAVASGSVWVGNRSEGEVVRIDPQRLTVRGSVAVPGFALGLTARGNDLWATDPVTGVVYRIDAARGELLETVRVGFDPHHVAVGDSTVWVANQGGDTVTMIGGARRSGIEVDVGNMPLHVELGGGSAWVTDSADGAVRRLDESTGETQAVIRVGAWPHALAYANGAVWVGTETGTFWKIDPATNSAEQVEGADFASIDTAVDGDNIWVADASGGTVVRFDTATGSVGSVIDLNEFGDCEAFLNEAPAPPRNTDL